MTTFVLVGQGTVRQGSATRPATFDRGVCRDPLPLMGCHPRDIGGSKTAPASARSPPRPVVTESSFPTFVAPSHAVMALDPRKLEAYLALRKAGFTKAAAAREVKISYASAKRFEAGDTPAARALGMQGLKQTPGTIPLDEVCDEAKRALVDFGYFRRRYFGRISTPWQEEAAYKVLAFLETPRKEFVVINCPPGSGKSTLFTHDIPAWLTCKKRHIRGLIGSVSQSLAEKYVLRLRSSFESEFPERAEGELLERGLAVDAEATLKQDFGLFRPENAILWSVKALIVAQHGDRFTGEKEPTWTAFGMDTGVIGGRYDFATFDDLVDDKSIQTLEAIEKTRSRYDKVLEKRLEPGGTMALPGQRLGPEDIYAYNRDKKAGASQHVDHSGCCDAENGRKYHHIRYRAHFEDRCADDHGDDAKPYPDGCLLDPRRLPWPELEAEQENDLGNYMQVYQQEDADPRAQLVNWLWINGGTDPETHEHFDGCWDPERDEWEIPKGLAPPLVSVATSDPSPAKFWAHQWWVYQPSTEQRILGACTAKVASADRLLDWDFDQKCFTGLMEEWWVASFRAGYPITHWIVEKNSQNRFLLKYDFARRWLRLRRVTLIGHETQSNKNDRERGVMGVSSVRTHWKHARYRLPGHGLGRVAAMKLCDEVTKYPKGRYDDQVMAQWFFEWNLPRLRMAAEAEDAADPNRPSWVKPGAGLRWTDDITDAEDDEELVMA